MSLTIITMNNNLKVLKLFVENKDKKYPIKRAAEALDMNYRIVYEEIMQLEKEELIRITRMGNSNLCEFNYQLSGKVVELEELRKKEQFKNKNIKLIYKRIKEAKSPFYALILFGSFASKTNTKHSDIDLCLISDNPEVTKEVQVVLSITPLDVHLVEFTSAQFISMLKSKGFNVGNEIVKNNIVLYGIESFYEMINNAK